MKSKCRHTEACKIGMATHGACPACLEAEVKRLREIIANLRKYRRRPKP